MKEASPEDPQALPNPSSLQVHLPSDSSKQIPEQEDGGCDPAIHLIPSLFLTFTSLTSSSLFPSIKFSRINAELYAPHYSPPPLERQTRKQPEL